MMKSIVLLCLLLLPMAKGLTVTLDPPTIDMGNVTPGESRAINLGVISGGAFEATPVSTSPWVSFTSGTVKVGAEKKEFIVSGSKIEANHLLSSILTIPPNAEPGEYSVSIGLDPIGTSEPIRMAGARVSFRVSGKPTRRINITSVEAIRQGELFTLFIGVRNSGTATANVAIVVEGAIRAGATVPVGPSEARVLPIYSGLGKGNYDIQISAEWEGGKESFGKVIEIKDIEENKSDKGRDYSHFVLPALIALLAVILMSLK